MGMITAVKNLTKYLKYQKMDEKFYILIMKYRKHKKKKKPKTQLQS